MKTWTNPTIGAALALAADAALAQSGNMMNGRMGGYGWMDGYGGIWTPILLVVVIAVVVVAIMKRGGK